MKGRSRWRGPKTVFEMLVETGEAFPERRAIVDEGISLTYEQLLGRVGALAESLKKRGIGKGSHVGLLLPNSLDYVVGYFGILGSGAVAVPLNEHYQLSELRYFVDECAIDLLLARESSRELWSEVLTKTSRSPELYSSEQWLGREGVRPTNLGPLAADLDSPVMIQFSSGSTGLPKRIARTHRNVLFEMTSLKKALATTPEDRFIGVAPFSHVNGLMRTMMQSLSAGASLYPLARYDRHKVASTIEREKITMFIAVPFMFSMLAKSRFEGDPDFSSLRYCISASAPMPEGLNREFHRRFGIYVRQLYGSTETGTISVDLSEDVETSLLSVGKPIEGVEVEVWRDDGSPSGPGELGEFAVKSPAAIQAYEGGNEISRQSFRGSWFLTGDLGRREKGGKLYLAGRKKFFINKGGYKINPGDIEEVLQSHPIVEEAAVVGVPTAMGDEKVKAVVVVAGECDELELVEYCRGKIADFKIPSVIEFRKELPKTSTGKIRKKMLID